MTPEEERAALAAKTEELAQTIAKTDRRLASLPQTPQTAEAREAMEKLLREMHRMEQNMRRLLRLCDDTGTEGGPENGSH